MLADLRARVVRLERGAAPSPLGVVLTLGHPGIEAHLPTGDLACGALHEVAGAGPDTEHAVAAAQFVAGLLAPLRGFVLWALVGRDLFAPGLAACLGLKWRSPTALGHRKCHDVPGAPDVNEEEVVQQVGELGVEWEAAVERFRAHRAAALRAGGR